MVHQLPVDKFVDVPEEVCLFGSWISSYYMRVRIALEEKGIKYEYKEVEERSPLLQKLNLPHNKLPVLIHNGKTLSDSLNIVQYLDEVYEDKAPLLPNDHHQRAGARYLADYFDKKIDECGRKVYMSKGDQEQEAGKEEFIQCLKQLEGTLGEKSFFGGQRFGYVDVALIPYYSWFYTYETIGKFSIEAECPKLVAWAKRCMERESVSKSLPDPKKVYDFVMKLKMKFDV